MTSRLNYPQWPPSHSHVGHQSLFFMTLILFSILCNLSFKSLIFSPPAITCNICLLVIFSASYILHCLFHQNMVKFHKECRIVFISVLNCANTHVSLRFVFLALVDLFLYRLGQQEQWVSKRLKQHQVAPSKPHLIIPSNGLQVRGREVLRN